MTQQTVRVALITLVLDQGLGYLVYISLELHGLLRLLERDLVLPRHPLYLHFIHYAGDGDGLIGDCWGRRSGDVE